MIQYYIQTCTVLLALLSLIFGISLTVNMIIHANDSIGICDNYRLNQTGIEIDMDIGHITHRSKYVHLYAWDYCQIKVFPISDDISCQCRNMPLYEEDIETWYSIIESNNSDIITFIFESILNKYYMLETFRFDASIFSYTNGGITFTDGMMIAKNLRVSRINTMSFESISNNFEFFRMDNVLINDLIEMDSWSNIKNLRVFSVSLSQFLASNVNWMCHWNELRYVGIAGAYGNRNLTSPDCTSDLPFVNNMY